MARTSVSPVLFADGNDMIWAPRPGATSPCLWGNMPFGKSVAVVQLARTLKVTHIIESGRMGGMSLTHYSHFGFGLVSVEARANATLPQRIEREAV